MIDFCSIAFSASYLKCTARKRRLDRGDESKVVARYIIYLYPFILVLTYYSIFMPNNSDDTINIALLILQTKSLKKTFTIKKLHLIFSSYCV